MNDPTPPDSERRYEAWMPENVIDASARISDARDCGLGQARMSSSKFVRPFHGVRSLTVAETPLQRARQYLSKLKREQWFGGITAMRLWGIPVPHRWDVAEPVRLVVPHDAYRPCSRGVRASGLVKRRIVAANLDGLRLLEPAQAVLSAAEELSIEDMVVAFDALVTDSAIYPGRHAALGTWTIEQIAAEIAAWGGGSAAKRGKAALEFVRVGVDSPQESRLRFAIVNAGLPEPVLQHEIAIDGKLRRLDTAWPEWRVGAEYEGDHHRTDAVQWHEDVGRERSISLQDWQLVRVTARDLRSEHRPSLMKAFWRALTRRGWNPEDAKNFET
ncbi:hypothetical protein [uncultured Agrococcus sp.]|uniref:hypothetical protein n=1 Tax=uncultured Agrococcus sp. TaxID=382258 RepID=UPI0025D848CB|nr:hypothetical protein [uncultured Agrococcus sp.]